MRPRKVIFLILIGVILCFTPWIRAGSTIATREMSEADIIKICNGILYRLMVDIGTPPFPSTACEVKQNVIKCFESNKGEGDLLNQDHFLLLQSAIVDKTLMCPELEYSELEDSLRNTSTANTALLAWRYGIETQWQINPEGCAVKIHQDCEKKSFDEIVVNHISWPKTTKWRECYNEAVQNEDCTAPILKKYACMQEEFGERLRQLEYNQGLFGIFMNDNKRSKS